MARPRALAPGSRNEEGSRVLCKRGSGASGACEELENALSPQIGARLPAGGPLGPGTARLLGGLARMLALLQPPLQQAEAGDEQGEAGNQDEAGIGDDLVVGLPVEPLAARRVVAGQRGGCPQREPHERGGGGGDHAGQRRAGGARVATGGPPSDLALLPRADQSPRPAPPGPRPPPPAPSLR